jgi:2-oxoglutarate ferredoxin oxidoreductase subunit beta
MEKLIEKYYRPRLPHIWCPGCGNGIVTSSIVKAIDKLGLDQDKTVIVSGIGCSSKLLVTLILIPFILYMVVLCL